MAKNNEKKIYKNYELMREKIFGFVVVVEGIHYFIYDSRISHIP